MSVSVIVPALNEEAALPATLAALQGEAEVHEIIVADGGSGDETARVAERHSARVIRAPRGRALQMNAGAAGASGNALLFLHADTLLPPGGVALAAQALARPDVAAGCFRLRFDRESPALRLWTLPIWMRWPCLAFGDRALFVRREAFDAVGGFPEQPIFEDLEMVRRLRGVGRFAFLDAAVVTSARRFRGGGAVRQQARNAALWGGWMLGVPPRRMAALYPYPPPSRTDR